MKRFIGMYLTLISILSMAGACVYAGESSAKQIASKVPTILNGIAWIGYAIAFGMFIYIGIKYMLSAANEKAVLKEGAINFIIGGILITCASVVANIVAIIAHGDGNLGGASGLASELISAATSAAGF